MRAPIPILGALFLALPAATPRAQDSLRPSSRLASERRSVLSGVVHDSADRAVARARLALLGTSLETASDSGGRFRLTGVPPGQHTLLVRTAALDSLGAVSRFPVSVVDSAAIKVRLPTLTTVAGAICATSWLARTFPTEQRRLIIGKVDRPAGSDGSVTVAAEWDGPRSLDDSSTAAQIRRFEVPADSIGVFRLCVPMDVAIRVRATTVGMSSAPLEVRVAPNAAYARADMRLTEHQIASAPTARRELVGFVRDTKGAAIANAEVQVHGATARSGDNGLFRLWTADVDTATISVRRLGYGMVAFQLKGRATGWDTVVVEMDTRTRLLDPMNVEAVRRRANGVRDFEERRAQGLGQFVTRAEIEARGTNRTTELLRTKRGIRVVRLAAGRSGVRFTLHASGRLGCEPAVWVDGQRMPGLEVDDILPSDIEAIELYETFAATPSEFVTGSVSACGTIVIWTRSPPPPKGKP